MKSTTIAMIAGVITFTIGFLSSPEYLANPLLDEVISGKVATLLLYGGGLLAVIGGGVALKNAKP